MNAAIKLLLTSLYAVSARGNKKDVAFRCNQTVVNNYYLDEKVVKILTEAITNEKNENKKK